VKSDHFVLINLEGGESFVFQLFPKDLETTQRANWEQQDTTIGTKPLYYANRDPRRISVPELWLDNTDSNQSLAPDIKSLFALQDETREHGRPPALLAIWGDRQERCVLEEVTVSEKFFSPTVTTTVRDVETDSGSGIGNF
jgi:hypothetical protein